MRTNLRIVEDIDTQLCNAAKLYGQMQEYSNKGLLNKLIEDGYSRHDAKELIDDVKKFLALAASVSEAIAPTKALDIGWHAFILFTREYSKFCLRYCGWFIHHEPVDKESDLPDYEMLPRTKKLAKAAFGALSKNWEVTKGQNDVDCNPIGCQDKECSVPDCSSNQ
ncbi:hypothetical protein COB87_002625 [Candidatus Wolfebacteria bacterium]|nr:hypothetical protein [Candidatus Wolfebacteria bacterium]